MHRAKCSVFFTHTGQMVMALAKAYAVIFHHFISIENGNLRCKLEPPIELCTEVETKYNRKQLWTEIDKAAHIASTITMKILWAKETNRGKNHTNAESGYVARRMVMATHKQTKKVDCVAIKVFHVQSRWVFMNLTTHIHSLNGMLWRCENFARTRIVHLTVANGNNIQYSFLLCCWKEKFASTGLHEHI